MAVSKSWVVGWIIISVVKLQIFFIFTPKIGEMIQFEEYFSKGLKPPTNVDCILIPVDG